MKTFTRHNCLMSFPFLILLIVSLSWFVREAVLVKNNDLVDLRSTQNNKSMSEYE